MASQLPDTMSRVLFFVGDTKRFEAVGDVFGLVGPTLDGAAWTVTAATLTLYAPDDALQTPIAGTIATIPYADYTIPDLPGEWAAYWTLTDGTNTETLGPFRFTVQEKKNT